MAVTGTERTRIHVNTPEHRPFSITGNRSYFIGFEDLIPGSLGEHLKDNMMGVWHPPFRIVESISLESGGSRLSAVDMTVFPDFRVFHAGGYEIEMSVPGGKDILSLRLRKAAGSSEELAVRFRIGVIPVWRLALKHASYIGEMEGIPTLGINSGEMAVRFNGTGKCSHSVGPQEISFTASGDCRIILEAIGEEDDVDSGYTTYAGRSVLDTGNDSLDGIFEWSKINMKWLYSDYGDGVRCINAGQPEFPWFFSIDTFIALNGLLSAGMSDIARNSLDTLFRIAGEQEGMMPHEILSNGEICNPGNLEELAYMPTALKRYHDWTLDTALVSKHIQTACKGIGSLLDRGLYGKGVMEDSNAGEGMDIDTICYFIRGAEDLIALSDRIGYDLPEDVRQGLESQAIEMTDFVRKDMWVDEKRAFADRYMDGVPMVKGFWTTIVPFETSIAGKWHFDRFLEGDYFNSMLTADGITVDPSGNVMAVNNGILAKGALNYGDPETAYEYHTKSTDTLGKFSTACFPEITTNEKGCFLQAWTGALNVENVVMGFLGVHAENGRFEVNPQIPEAWRDLDISLGNLAVSGDLKKIHFGLNDDGKSTFSVE